ncbi:hypothetical protein PV379_44275, partial [Streptomyces caniscabiei]|uniref:hypothetical protein n=1 Tax=Streptomyces caniscabiei TaxID=2746961 RepID=UPI0029B9E421
MAASGAVAKQWAWQQSTNLEWTCSPVARPTHRVAHLRSSPAGADDRSAPTARAVPLEAGAGGDRG